jgi:hypothetical protein
VRHFAAGGPAREASDAWVPFRPSLTGLAFASPAWERTASVSAGTLLAFACDDDDAAVALHRRFLPAFQGQW